MDITLTGTFCSSNKGDAAMQLVGIDRLSTIGDVFVDTPSPDHDAALYGRDRVVHCGRREPGRIILQSAAALVVGLTRRLGLGSADRLLLTDELRRLGDRGGLVVDLSGDMLTEDYGFVVGLSHFIPLAQAQWMGTRVIVCAQSVGPFHRLRPLAGTVLRRCDLVTVRDEISLEHLRPLGLSPEVTADLAFQLRPDDDGAERVLARHGIGDRPFLAVSVSPIIERRFEAANPGSSFAEVVALALRSVESTALRIVFVPHVTGPGVAKDDRVTAARVAGRLGPDVVQIVTDLDPRVVKGVIGRAQAIVGCRMHANIAALSQGVPALAISYSHKTSGIMDLLGLGHRVVDGADLTDHLQPMLAACLASVDVDRSLLRARLPEVRSRSARNIDRIVEVVGTAAR